MSETKPAQPAQTVPVEAAAVGPQPATIPPTQPPPYAQQPGGQPPMQAGAPNYATPEYYHANAQPHMIVSGMPAQYQVITVPAIGPTMLWCPYDQKPVLSHIEHRPGFSSGLWTCIYCFLCYWWSWIPILCGCCDETVHKCPQCHRVLAVVP